MTISFDKDPRESGRITVNFDCPWCDTHQVAGGRCIVSGFDSDAWVVMICTSAACALPSLLRVPLEGNNGALWVNITQSDPRLLMHGELEIHPTARPNYDEDGVPDEIASDFEEALQCQAAGFQYGAALVGRRVLQAAIRERGGVGKDLKTEINSLSTDVLNKPLKDSAHEVRFVGNDAAHTDTVTADDVEALLSFTRDVLHTLYVVPHRVAARRKSAGSKK